MNEFPKKLVDFGYAFNDEGKLRKIDIKTGLPGGDGFDFNVSKDANYNQRHYEAMGDVITEHIYELLKQNGMHKIYMPNNGQSENESTFIFSSQKTLQNPRKLIVLIHGSGVVRAGQWARSLIINNSLDAGTQIPYILKAKLLGYDIVIMNTNDHYRIIDGKRKSIHGSTTPLLHAVSVWDKYIIGSQPDSVSVVAHSYGGVVTVELAKKYPEFFKNKVFAVGFTDSVHTIAGVSPDIGDILKAVGRNWVTSDKPLDTPLSNSGNDIPRYSAGHTKHEWTSYACMSALFKYFESSYEKYQALTASNKPKLEL